MTPVLKSASRKLRTSETLPQMLDRRLLVYALAAGATLASSAPSHAEVLYTPSNAVFRASSGKFEIDLNHDGTSDIIFVGRPVECCSGYGLAPGLVAYGNPSNQIAAYWDGLALAFARRDPITRGGFWQKSVLIQTAIGYVGVFENNPNHFLGVRFLINGNVHYGWIGFRGVRADYPNVSVSLAGWAYETKPNTPIAAGDMGSRTEDSPSIQPTSLEVLAGGHTAIEQRRKRNAQ
jgi:hypothetical protein